MSERFACVDCGISLPPIEPRMFSFNGPHGACPACDGLGARDVVDPERVRRRSAPHAARRRGARVGSARQRRARDGARARRRGARRQPRRRLVEAPRATTGRHPVRKRPACRATSDAPPKRKRRKPDGARKTSKRLRGHRPAPRAARRRTGRRPRRRATGRRSRRRARAASATTSSAASSSRAPATPARASASAPRRSR